MGADWIRDPKRVLIFNGNRTLIGIVRSVLAASQITGTKIQSIANACNGVSISSSGFYFRHIDDNIIVELNDLDTLKIEEYDELCGIKREYHTVAQMAKYRRRALGIEPSSLTKPKKKCKIKAKKN